jgi:hypothetical protein
MSDIRSFMITGGAVADYMGEKKKKGGRRTKKSQEGGTVIDVAPFTTGLQSQPSAASHATPVPSISHSQASQASQVHNPMPAPSASGIPSHVVVVPKMGGDSKALGGDSKALGGDSKAVKVELKKKQATHKVKLQPKKEVQKKLKSKKTRKFTIGISALHKRVTRAKKVHKKVKEMPLAALKELLISKKLIKSTSVAPESVLRQIAADSHIIDKNAL